MNVPLDLYSDSTLGAPRPLRMPAAPDTRKLRRNLADPMATTAVLWGYALVGSVAPWHAVVVFACAMALEALLWALPMLGRKRSRRDDTAHALQVGGACALNLLALMLDPQVGGLFVLLLFAPLCASGLAPSRRLFSGLRLLVLAGLVCALALADFQIGIAAEHTGEKCMLVLSLALALWRFMAVESRASGLRAALYDRNRQLTQASNHFAHLARHDELTGLPNRREAMRVLELESQRAERCGTALWVAMLDADHFKQVNDRHGHAVGDAVLKDLAQVLQASVRSVDHVFRFGGEEFLLLLVDHADGDALRPMERLREAVHRHDWTRLAPELNVTVSIGMTGRATGEDADRVLRRADAALYQAKADGRNRLRLL